MRNKSRDIIMSLHPKQIADTFPKFLKDEAISGKLILLAAVLALIAVNSPLRHIYDSLWQNQLSVGLAGHSLSLDLRNWINEGLMGLFFLVVGLEIKREIVSGELRDRKKAILPVAAAVGGMIVPALIYIALNHTPATLHGWGIPIATDIAFAVAVLTLLGDRVPSSLKLFLLTLAIADDIGAIFVIALFYAKGINVWYLGLSVLILVATWTMRKKLARSLSLYVLIGLVLWFFVHLSGIHASIVGAAMGLLAPMAMIGPRDSIAKRLEDFFLPISTYAVLPLFAFANAGVVLSTRAFRETTSLSVMVGIILGLAFGKLIGITLVSWLMVRLKQARLPDGVSWRQIVGVASIAGVGFTVSIFITELAFAGNELLGETAKIGIFVASILSALLGTAILSGRNPKKFEK